MKITELILISLWLLLLVSGQIFFKYTSRQIDTENFQKLLNTLLFSSTFWLAITLYAIATVLWIVILKSIPLSKALPFSAMSFIIVPLISSHVFGEDFVWYYWLGVLLILVGMGVTTNAVR